MVAKSKKAFPPSCSFYTTLRWTMTSRVTETWSSVWVAQWVRGRDRAVPELFSSWLKQLILFFNNSEIKDQQSGNCQLISFPHLTSIFNNMPFQDGSIYLHFHLQYMWHFDNTALKSATRHVTGAKSLLKLFCRKTSNQQQLVKWL